MFLGPLITSYRPRVHIDYQIGGSDYPVAPPSDEKQQPDKSSSDIQLIPVDDTVTWSHDTSNDLLF